MFGKNAVEKLHIFTTSGEGNGPGMDYSRMKVIERRALQSRQARFILVIIAPHRNSLRRQTLRLSRLFSTTELLYKLSGWVRLNSESYWKVMMIVSC
jgi:hypothetical protein